MNDKFSTDLSREDFDYPDQKEAGKFHLISMAVSFCTGMVIGAFLIMGFMSLID